MTNEIWWFYATRLWQLVNVSVLVQWGQSYTKHEHAVILAPAYRADCWFRRLQLQKIERITQEGNTQELTGHVVTRVITDRVDATCLVRSVDVSPLDMCPSHHFSLWLPLKLRIWGLIFKNLRKNPKFCISFS